MQQLGGFDDEIDGVLAGLRADMPAILTQPDNPARQAEAAHEIDNL